MGTNIIVNKKQRKEGLVLPLHHAETRGCTYHTFASICDRRSIKPIFFKFILSVTRTTEVVYTTRHYKGKGVSRVVLAQSQIHRLKVCVLFVSTVPMSILNSVSS